MKNILVTLNINNILTDNSKSSFLFAADRWQVDFLEFKENFFTDYYPSFNKFKILESFLDYDRVIFLDADTLINHLAPNPFLTYFGDFCAVKDVHSKNINFILENNIELDYLTPYFNFIRQNIDSKTNDDYIINFFNSGVMMFSPSKTYDIIQKNKKLLPNVNDENKLHLISHYEQALLNYIIQNNFTIEFMNSKWNVIDPDTERQMDGFIYHFTGKKNDFLKTKINSYKWK